jgi:hypothetical protein
VFRTLAQREIYFQTGATSCQKNPVEVRDFSRSGIWTASGRSVRPTCS